MVILSLLAAAALLLLAGWTALLERRIARLEKSAERPPAAWEEREETRPDRLFLEWMYGGDK